MTATCCWAFPPHTQSLPLPFLTHCSSLCQHTWPSQAAHSPAAHTGTAMAAASAPGPRLLPWPCARLPPASSESVSCCVQLSMLWLSRQAVGTYAWQGRPGRGASRQQQQHQQQQQTLRAQLMTVKVGTSGPGGHACLNDARSVAPTPLRVLLLCLWDQAACALPYTVPLHCGLHSCTQQRFKCTLALTTCRGQCPCQLHSTLPAPVFVHSSA
jgi:hypothetical protein